MEIKEELAKTSINITCYDRNGDVVKRVTSSDDGTVEDPEGGDDNPGGGDNGGGNGGSQSGSGSENQNQGGDNGGSNGGNSQPQTPTVNAPNFSGATQFEESTQVTMTGTTGASIFYTLDGSTPTAESTLYEGPITLSETTVVKAIAMISSTSVATRQCSSKLGIVLAAPSVQGRSIQCRDFEDLHQGLQCRRW